MKDPWAMMAGALALKPTIPDGKGWKTMREIEADHPDTGVVRVRRTIASELKAGRLEVFNGSQVNVAGTQSRQCWYRPVV